MTDIHDEELSRLPVAAGNVLESTTKIVGDTVKNTLKTKPTIEISEFKFQGNLNDGVILDASMVKAAFEFFMYQKTVKNVPSDVSDNSSKDNFTVTNKVDSTIQPPSDTELESSLHIDEIGSLDSNWQDLDADLLELYEFFGNQTSMMDNTYHTEIPSSINQSRVTAGEQDKILNIDLNEIQDSCKFSMAAKDTCPKVDSQKERSFLNTGKQNLNSKNVYENYYFPDELDYEPSEIGEFDIEVVDVDEAVLDVEDSGNLSDHCPNAEGSRLTQIPVKVSSSGMNRNFSQFHIKQQYMELQDNAKQMPYELDSKTVCKRNIELDDESESDTEHSFKRTSNRGISEKRQGIPRQSTSKSVPMISNSETSFSHLNSINEVAHYVRDQCRIGNVYDAVLIANRYIQISENADKVDIFKELFISMINLINDPDSSLDDSMSLECIERTMDIFDSSKLFDPNLCSLIIYKCCFCDLTIPTAKQVLSSCQEMKIPIDTHAISSYVDVVEPAEVPLYDIIKFLEYVKNVCKTASPKFLLQEALERFVKGQESSLRSGFYKLCKFLGCIKLKEVDRDCLQNFIKYCIKNDCWTQIAEFFQSWIKQTHLMVYLFQTFLFQPEDTGLFYKKFAEEVYRNGHKLSSHLVSCLGQMGVFLMLEAFSGKHLVSAFEILHTLHKYNINYIQLQEPLYSMHYYMKSMPNPSTVFVFPFTVAFKALDICLHLVRPRDAYQILQSFSLTVPEYLGEKLKADLKQQQFWYLLKVTHLLHPVEPLGIGLDAFHDLLSTANDFSVEELKEFVKDFQIVYNKYLICVINGQLLSPALEFCEYSEGPKKDIFVLNPKVLRGLIAFFAQEDMMEVARRLFALGCARKVYGIEKKSQKCIWHLIILSSWTIFEVKLAVETLIQKLSPDLGPGCKISFDNKLVAKITFRESENVCSQINCLKECPSSIDALKEITRNAIESINSNLTVTEHMNPPHFELCFKASSIKPKNQFQRFAQSSNSTANFATDVEKCIQFKEIELKASVEGPDQRFCSSDLPVTKISQLTPKYLVADSSPKKVIPESTSVLAPELAVPESTLEFTPKKSVLLSSDQLTREPDTPLASHESSPKQEMPQSIGSVTPVQFVSDNVQKLPSQTIIQESVASGVIISKSSLQLTPNGMVSRSSHQMNSVQTISSNLVGLTPEQEQVISSSNELARQKHHYESTPKTIPDEMNIPANSGEVSLSNDQLLLEDSRLVTVKKSVKKKVFKRKVSKKGPSKSAKFSISKTIQKVVSKTPNVAVLKRTPSKNHRKKASLKLGNEVVSKKVLIANANESVKSAKLSPVKKTVFQRSPASVNFENLRVTLASSNQSNTPRLVKPISEANPAQVIFVKPVSTEKSARLNYMKPVSEKKPIDVPVTEFEKIVMFLKSKILLKSRVSTPSNQQEKANELARAFVQNNAVTILDKKTMKLLNEFAEKSIN